MGANRGSNPAGVAGIMSISGGNAFNVSVYNWKRSSTLPTRERSGRSLPRFGAFRKLNAHSVISFRATAGGYGFPSPTSIISASGTVTLQFDGAKKVTVVGEILGYEEAFTAGKNPADKGAGEEWDIGVSMRLTAEPTYAGWPGSQNTPTTQTFTDQETDDGLSKTSDPNGLVRAATRRIDVGTLTDTDAGEALKLTSSINVALGRITTSASPMTGMKLRTGRLDRTDRGGGIVSLEFGQRDTKDDITMESTSRHVDQYGLENMATSAMVLSGTIPTTAVGLISAGIDYRQLYDGRFVQVSRLEPNTSVQKQTFPRTNRHVDPFALESYATSAVVANGTIPAPTLLQSTTKEYTQIIPGKYLTITALELNNSKQKETFPKTVRLVDPTGIETYATSAVVHAGTIPTTVTTLTSASTEYVQKTPGQYVSVTKFETLNPAERMEAQASTSTRFPEEFVDAFGEVLASTATNDAEATAQWTVLQNVANFYGLTLHSINRQRKLLVTEYRTPGTRVIGATYGGRRTLPAINNSGTVQVYLPKVIPIYGSLKKVWHQSIRGVSRPRRRFTLIEMLNDATLQDESGTVGKTNNQTITLLGSSMAQGTCIYNGAEFDVNVGLTGGAYPQLVRYEFEVDSAGIFDYQGVQDDWFYTLQSVVAGYNNASLFSGEGQISVTIPAQADFQAIFG